MTLPRSPLSESVCVAVPRRWSSDRGQQWFGCQQHVKSVGIYFTWTSCRAVPRWRAYLAQLDATVIPRQFFRLRASALGRLATSTCLLQSPRPSTPTLLHVLTILLCLVHD